MITQGNIVLKSRHKSGKKREALTSLWSKKLHYKFIEATEDGDFMLALNTGRLLRRMVQTEEITDNKSFFAPSRKNILIM